MDVNIRHKTNTLIEDWIQDVNNKNRSLDITINNGLVYSSNEIGNTVNLLKRNTNKTNALGATLFRNLKGHNTIPN